MSFNVLLLEVNVLGYFGFASIFEKVTIDEPLGDVRLSHGVMFFIMVIHIWYSMKEPMAV